MTDKTTLTIEAWIDPYRMNCIYCGQLYDHVDPEGKGVFTVMDVPWPLGTLLFTLRHPKVKCPMSGKLVEMKRYVEKGKIIEQNNPDD